MRAPAGRAVILVWAALSVFAARTYPRIGETLSGPLGYVRNHLSSDFRPNSMTTWNTEHGLEFNVLLDIAPMILLQPVVQYYANVGGGSDSAVVVGFRTKVEF